MKIGETIKGMAAMRTERMNNKEEKEILDAAITYLKRMEPKKIEMEGGGSIWWFVCPECNGSIGNTDHFCKHYGQALMKM